MLYKHPIIACLQGAQSTLTKSFQDKLWNLRSTNWARKGEAFEWASKALGFYTMHIRAQGTLNLSNWFQPNSGFFLSSFRVFLKRMSSTAKAPLGALQMSSTNTSLGVFSQQ